MDGFTVVVHGLIEGAESLAADMLYCRCTLVKGKDWILATAPSGTVGASTPEIITQMCERLPGPVAKFTWNAPFDFTLTSTNTFGWPQMAIALTTVDNSGKDVVVGYARCHIPAHAGHYTKDLPLIEPIASTPQHKLFGFFSGTRPELRDPSFLCSGEDRIVMTAKMLSGYVRVTFDVVVSGRQALGYDF